MSAAMIAGASVDPREAGLSGLHRVLGVAAVLAATVLVVLDAAIANIALPTIARSLDVTPASSVLVITGYQLALVMALLPGAALGESLGFRRVFAICVGIFTLASFLCSVAPSLAWLVAARFLQGIGGAAMMALGVALLRNILPTRLLGAAIGWNALAVALGSAAGPTIGALILSVADWRWLFVVNLPLGGAVILASRVLPRAGGTGRPLNKASAALNGVSFAALVLGAEWLVSRPALAIPLLGLSALGMTALVRRERHKPAPLIPIDLLGVHSFRISVIASICCFTGQTAGLVALPFYLQHVLHLSALATGLLITPWPLTVALVAPIAGRLSDRVPTARLCAVGGICLAMGLAGAALWPLRGQAAPLVPMVMLCGLGFGLFQVPNNRTMYLAAPSERSGAAGGMQGTARLTGQTLGALLMTLLFTIAPLETAPRLGLVIGAALTLLAAFVSMLRASARS